MSLDSAPSAVAKVVLVLEALPNARGVTEISRSTGLSTSTVHRILRELAAVGWVRVDSDHHYLPGVRLLSLAGQSAGVTQLVRPILQRLCADTGHTVHFALRSGDEAVYVDKLEGDRAYTMRSRVGLSIPLYCTAIGKAILAGLSAPELREVLARIPLVALTPRTITDPDLLNAHLSAVAARGYAVDDEENEAHTRCLGAAVLDHHGVPVGGISVSALAFDLDRAKVRTCAPLLIAAARAASHALGLPQA
ncbi:IclR family transcriptional regulator [Nocardia altamirensis]|uniref:IclR family transcriptional regulator n=1 Tax=Nocardia altamirensis TaxID=472158 RepID=UPI00143554D3|nr:IclR family transcriptional regulator [Nocardia altamirensis]